MALPFTESVRGIIDKIKLDVVRDLNDRLVKAQKPFIRMNYGEFMSFINTLTDWKNARDVKDALENLGIIKAIKFKSPEGPIVNGYEITQSIVSRVLEESSQSRH